MPRDATLDAYVQSMRDDLSRGKVGIINNVMRLNSEEAKTFWPIYQQYEQKLFALGDTRVEVIRRFAADQRAGVLEGSQAAQFGKAFFEFETKRIELVRTYYERISQELSPVRAAQFAQIEHRTGTIIDLLIASEIPLIQDASTERVK